MIELKCPFCQQELKELHVNGFSVGFRCKNKNCPETSIMCGTKALWQELIRTRKELEQSEICCTEWEKQALDYKAENIALSGDLDRTHKALTDTIKLAEEMLESIEDEGMCSEYYEDRLNEIKTITALEQKDK